MIAPGQRVGKYTIEGRLGAGGMGEVYRGFDETLQRPVAIKVLPDADAMSPEARARMLREARAASALRHPNIVMVHEVGEDDDRTYLVMELVDGETLTDLVKRRGALPIDEAAGLLRQLGAALGAAHEAGFLHRDIKSSNLMLDSHGVLKVLDFGLSKRMLGPDGGAAEPAPARPEAGTVAGKKPSARAGGDGATVPARGKSVPRVSGDAPTIEAPNRPPLGDDLTIAGHGMGTAGCSAPELMDGSKVDARADVFSMGVVLYELTTGRRPYDGASWDEVRAQIGREDFRPPRELGVPAAVDAVIVRALRPDAAARWPSAAALVEALDAATASTVARRRARAPWIAVGAVVAGAAVAGAAVMVRRGGEGGHAVAPPPAPPDAAPVVVALEVDAAVEVDAGPAGPTPAALTRLGACAQRPAFLDDDTVVFDVTRDGDKADVWKVELATGTATRLVGGPADECCAAPGRTGKEVVHLIRDHADGARSLVAALDVVSGQRVDLAPGEQRAAAAAGVVYLYVTGDGRELRQWTSEQDEAVVDVAGVRPSALAVDRDGRRIVLAGDGELARAAICTVDLTAPAVACRPAHRPQPVRADFGKAGAIYFASYDGLRVLDPAGTDRVAVPGAEPSGGLAVSPSGAHLVYSDCTYRSAVIDTGAAPARAIDTGADDRIEALATGPGGRLIYVNSTDQLVVRSPDEPEKRLAPSVGHMMLGPQLDATGARVAVTLDGPTPGIYAGTLTDGLQRVTERAEDGRPLFLADGSIVFTRGRTVLRVTPGDSEILVPLGGPRRALGLDHARGRVLLVDDDGALTWWDPAAGRETPGPSPAVPDGARVDDATLAPGGGWLLVTDERGRLWRGRLGDSWQPVAVEHRLAPGVTRGGAAITDDGHVLVIEQRLRGELWQVAAPAGATW